MQRKLAFGIGLELLDASFGQVFFFIFSIARISADRVIESCLFFSSAIVCWETVSKPFALLSRRMPLSDLCVCETEVGEYKIEPGCVRADDV